MGVRYVFYDVKNEDAKEIHQTSIIICKFSI